MAENNETLFAQQQAQLASCQQRIAQLEAELSQAPLANPTLEVGRDPKVPDVPLFSGDSKKCFEFLSQLNIFFKLMFVVFFIFSLIQLLMDFLGLFELGSELLGCVYDHFTIWIVDLLLLNERD